MSAPLELRPQVAAFAQLMERALRANDHKGGWARSMPTALMRRLQEEATELDQELDRAHDHIWRDWDPAAHAAGEWPQRQVIVSYCPVIGWRCTDTFGRRRWQPDADAIERIGGEAADVANFAMMIADVCGALK